MCFFLKNLGLWLRPKFLGYCGPLWPSKFPWWLWSRPRGRRGSQQAVTSPGAKPFTTVALFKIWNLSTNQVPGRDLNVEIEVCWKDTKYYLYLRIVECVDSILGVNVSKPIWTSFLCWCPLALHQITLSFLHWSFTEKKTFIPIAMKII